MNTAIGATFLELLVSPSDGISEATGLPSLQAVGFGAQDNFVGVRQVSKVAVPILSCLRPQRAVLRGIEAKHHAKKSVVLLSVFSIINQPYGDHES